MENLRFKFRAYNKELRKMYEVDTICPYEDNHTKGGEVFLKGIQYNSFYFPEEVEVMQCTGLKDKNGKLVYEGDIVNYDDRDLDPSHKPILNAVIELRKYQWCMVYYRKDVIDAYTRKPAERKTWLGFDDFISSRIEVIGNIYENKELIER